MNKMDTALTVRPIRSEDALAVAELIVQLGHNRAAEDVRKWIDALRARPGQAAFVAERNSEVVGWIEVSLEHRLQYDSLGLIGGLVVRDGLRSLGIGRRLCEEAEEWTRRQGVKKIRVTSRSTREDAHRFYLRDGYRQTKISVFFEKMLGV
jgi:GNAT superfamily N-acetyltransferase